MSPTIIWSLSLFSLPSFNPTSVTSCLTYSLISHKINPKVWNLNHLPIKTPSFNFLFTIFLLSLISRFKTSEQSLIHSLILCIHKGVSVQIHSSPFLNSVNLPLLVHSDSHHISSIQAVFWVFCLPSLILPILLNLQ